MAVAQTEAEDLPLIEEQVDTGLDELLGSYRATYTPGSEIKDELHNHYALIPSQPLAEFSHGFGKAFAARDLMQAERAMYAVVLDNEVPYRRLVDEVGNFNHPNMVGLIDSGTVQCSHVNEARQVLFIERPKGTLLSEFMKTTPKLHEHRVIDFILQPLVKALLALREKKFSHGHIHPNNVYVGDTTMLGECYSAPCGSLGHFIFEPPERLCDPLGRGEANEKSDVYALAVLAYTLLYNTDRFKNMPQQEFARLAMDGGIYNMFAGHHEFSDTFQDFFRGVLIDDPNERWDLTQVAQWLGGKRFNMIAPSAPKEASRSFAFIGQNYFGRRPLAHALHSNWREALKDIRSMKLDRWCEVSLHRPEMAERVERTLRLAGDASTDRQVSDMLTRIISILDQAGPLRSMSVSTRPDGIGPMLANCMRLGSQNELGQLLNMIETDVANYWSELDEFNKQEGPSLWKLARLRQFLKSPAFGFGIERALYDLNPSLSCQSELLRRYHITEAVDVLKALDAMSRNLAPDTSFTDRHLAAFVATKVDITKEIRLFELQTLPALANNPELVVLRILARAQQRQDRLQLIGLTTWAAMRIEKMLDEIHNRASRKHLKLKLKKLAATGNLTELLGVVNKEVAQKDHQGFVQAIALHQINHQKIERFQNPRLIDYYAKELGGKMASTISYFILAVTSYVTLSNWLGI